MEMINSATKFNPIVSQKQF